MISVDFVIKDVVIPALLLSEVSLASFFEHAIALSMVRVLPSPIASARTPPRHWENCGLRLIAKSVNCRTQPLGDSSIPWVDQIQKVAVQVVGKR